MAFGRLSVKGRALRYLAQREHSRAELERKLARRVEDLPEASAAEQIERALDELAAAGLLSEARVAESVLAAQGARFGARRLRQTLQAKGLDAELVAATLRQAEASELDRARAVWQRKFGSLPASGAERARQARFLAGRGFAGDVIQRVLKGGAEAWDGD
jgi:regulatory protein